MYVWHPHKIISNTNKKTSYRLVLPEGSPGTVDELIAIQICVNGHYYDYLRTFDAEEQACYCKTDSVNKKLVYLTPSAFKREIIMLGDKFGNDCVVCLLFKYDTKLVNPRIQLANEDSNYIAIQLLRSLSRDNHGTTTRSIFFWLRDQMVPWISLSRAGMVLIWIQDHQAFLDPEVIPVRQAEHLSLHCPQVCCHYDRQPNVKGPVTE